MVGACFAFPLLYLLWHDAGLGTDFVDVLRAEDVGEPLRNTLVLATTVAVAATALGTALAWLVTERTFPAGGPGASSYPCRSSCRASSARSR